MPRTGSDFLRRILQTVFTAHTGNHLFISQSAHALCVFRYAFFQQCLNFFLQALPDHIRNPLVDPVIKYRAVHLRRNYLPDESSVMSVLPFRLS